MFLYIYLSCKAPENGLLDQALYKCFIIIIIIGLRRVTHQHRVGGIATCWSRDPFAMAPQTCNVKVILTRHYWMAEVTVITLYVPGEWGVQTCLHLVVPSSMFVIV